MEDSAPRLSFAGILIRIPAGGAPKSDVAQWSWLVMVEIVNCIYSQRERLERHKGRFACATRRLHGCDARRNVHQT